MNTSVQKSVMVQKYPEFGKLTLDDPCCNNLKEVYNYKLDANYNGLMSTANFYSMKKEITTEPVIEKLHIEEKGEVLNEQIAINLTSEVINPIQEPSDNIEIANKTSDFSQDIPDVVTENLKKETSEIQLISKNVRKVRFDGDELLNTDFSDYEDVWEDYIPNLDISILAGRGGIGKTNLYLQLAISIVVKKEEYLGNKINLKSPSVLIIGTEDNGRRLKNRIQKHLSKIAPGCSIKDLIIITSGEELIKTKRSELEKKSFILVVIDALGDVFDGDMNSQIDSRKFYNDFQKLIDEFNTAFLFVTHEGKSQNKDRKSRILGSVAIVDRARSVFILSRDVRTGLRTLTIEKSITSLKKKLANHFI
jgi:RecA-family ATPase